MIRHCCWLPVLLFWTSVAFSQYKVTFNVQHLPANFTGDSIYIAGAFNNWNPQHPQYQLKKRGEQFGITIELPRDMYEYKFTTGGWDHVETAAGGAPIENRVLTVESDTTVPVTIEDWASHFPQKEKDSTAGKNVHIMDTVFYMPQLDRHRRIWVYLPPSYCRSKKNYPVLYMHDGQNVFDDATAYAGEWGVDEALDSLSQRHGEVIVVAVDNGGDKRLNEYSPYDNPAYGKGEGDAYVDFLVQTLMPYINKHYRTKKGGRYTYVAGSSMGGLISLYAVLKYPKKFAAAGVFSPAFWLAPQLKEFAAQQAEKVRSRIYFYGGQMESETMVPDMLAVFEALKSEAKPEMTSVIRAEGRHNEKTWREEFPAFYKWLKVPRVR